MKPDSVDAAVRSYYSAPETVDAYAGRNRLFPAEERLLARLGGALRDAAVLDLGCGAGRAASFLAGASRRSFATDLSLTMLARYRQGAPRARLFAADARCLALRGGLFGAVFALFNVVDEVDHEDRLRILGEVHRLLAPGGVFVFSSHNLDWAPRSTRVFPGTRPGPHHAVVVESFDGVEVPSYFVRREGQVRQLEEAGFGGVETFAADGSPLAVGVPCGDELLHYLARKAAA